MEVDILYINLHSEQKFRLKISRKLQICLVISGLHWPMKCQIFRVKYLEFELSPITFGIMWWHKCCRIFSKDKSIQDIKLIIFFSWIYVGNSLWKGIFSHNENETLHYRLRSSIGFLNMQKVSKSRQLFLTKGTSKTDNFALFVKIMTQIFCKIIFS